MKLKLTSRSFLYIALLAILIIVFYYGVQFIGTSREGIQFSGMSGVTPTDKNCRFGSGTNCISYCKNITGSNGNKFDTGTCHNEKCWCGTSSGGTSSRGATRR
jgi:hypothetical protein